MSTRIEFLSLGDFPDTSEIKRQAKYVEHMRERLAQAEKALTGMVERFQEVCEHDFENVRQRYNNYQPKKNQPKGQDVFTGRRCRKCKLFLPRPKGCPWEVCYKCGGAMKALDKPPESLYFSYKCQDCGHEYESLTEL